MCREVFREASSVFMDSKGAIQPRRLASPRPRIDELLIENGRHSGS